MGNVDIVNKMSDDYEPVMMNGRRTFVNNTSLHALLMRPTNGPDIVPRDTPVRRAGGSYVLPRPEEDMLMYETQNRAREMMYTRPVLASEQASVSGRTAALSESAIARAENAARLKDIHARRVMHTLQAFSNGMV